MTETRFPGKIQQKSLAIWPMDFLPSTTYPMINIYIYWTGATPEETSDNIADPVERVIKKADKSDSPIESEPQNAHA